jgi:hypothetical protein
MRRSIVAFAVVAAAVMAAPALAKVPNGNGLELLESPIPLVCVDSGGGEHTTTNVLVTPGNGATGWRVDVDGEAANQHHVLSYFAITVNGQRIVEKTWGVKQGLASLDCSQWIPEIGTTIEGTIYPLPGKVG